MNKYRVSFQDTFENCESIDQAYDALIEYLAICVKYGDVDGFNFELIEVEEKTNANIQRSNDQKTVF